jgi:hypothetical protein
MDSARTVSIDSIGVNYGDYDDFEYNKSKQDRNIPIGILDIEEYISRHKARLEDFSKEKIFVFNSSDGYVYSRTRMDLINPNYSPFHVFKNRNQTWVYSLERKWFDFTGGRMSQKRVYLSLNDLDNVEDLDKCVFFEWGIHPP